MLLFLLKYDPKKNLNGGFELKMTSHDLIGMKHKVSKTIALKNRAKISFHL